jgi:hypothetical protein
MHKDVEDKSLAELAPSYEVAFAYLVHMLEDRFVNWWRGDDGVKASSLIHGNSDRKLLEPS